jgi:hypothetical protein
VASGGSIRVTVNTTSLTTPGSYQFQVNLTSGTLTATQAVTIQVTDLSRRHSAK